MRYQGSRILDMMAHSASRCGRISTKEDRRARRKTVGCWMMGPAAICNSQSESAPRFSIRQERDCNRVLLYYHHVFMHLTCTRHQVKGRVKMSSV